MTQLQKLQEHKLIESIFNDVSQFDLKNELKENPTEYEYYIRNSAFYLTHFNSLLDQLQNAIDLLSNYNYSKNDEIGRGKHLTYNVENYIIRISSVSDRLLQLINAIFHLGIHENHVNERHLLKNMKVSISKIPEEFKYFKKTISDSDGNRNTIVHRHSIMDEKLNKIEIFYHPELIKQFFSKADEKEINKLKLVRKRALTDLLKSTKSEFNNQIEECIKSLFPIFDSLKVKYDKIIKELR